MADPIFEHPRLASIYDELDPDRSDLDVYVAVAEDLGARGVLDVGCGTGTFALLLADRGFEVTGIDPASGSLDVARAKPGSERVRWILGDVKALPPMQIDLATMTGNVAQAIVDHSDFEERCAGSMTRCGQAGISCLRRAIRQDLHGRSGIAPRPTESRR
jgi:SAM-dependent methyltransferase